MQGDNETLVSDEIAHILLQGYVTSSCIFALAEIGYFTLLENCILPSCAQAATDLDVSPELLAALCRAAEAAGLIRKVEEDRYMLTVNGHGVCDRLGYFTWALGGYGGVFANLARLARGEKFGCGIRRNDEFVARGAGAVGGQLVLPVVNELVRDLRFRKIVDLGCGSGSLIIRLCSEFPRISAVGLDISPDACRVARENAKRCGIDGRVHILQADVADALSGARSSHYGLIEDADVVSCFFMLHDLMRSGDGGLALLSRLRASFRPTTRFLIADTMKWESGTIVQPGFSTAFELVHAAMRQPVFSRNRYDELFAAAKFNVLKAIQLEIPSSWLYVLSAT
jgi:SAM-dependent methyltransferase